MRSSTAAWAIQRCREHQAAAHDFWPGELLAEHVCQSRRDRHRVATSQNAAGEQLEGAVRAWWNDLDAIAYRPRTTPATSFNIAFFGLDAFHVESWTLATRADILGDLVVRHGFTVDWNIAS